MAKKAANLARKQKELQESLADLYIETLRRVAPRSSQRLIESGLQLMEAHREFLAERMARLERVKARITKTSGRAASRKVAVKRAAPRRAKKKL